MCGLRRACGLIWTWKRTRELLCTDACCCSSSSEDHELLASSYVQRGVRIGSRCISFVACVWMATVGANDGVRMCIIKASSLNRAHYQPVSWSRLSSVSPWGCVSCARNDSAAMVDTSVQQGTSSAAIHCMYNAAYNIVQYNVCWDVSGVESCR